MSGTLLEQCRAAHEDIERNINAMVDLLRKDTRSQKSRIVQQHRVRRRVDEVCDRSKQLKVMYEDNDGARANELAAMTGPDAFRVFYERLGEIRQYHRKFPAKTFVTDGDKEAAEMEEDQVLEQFSGEEVNGRYLDLTALHQQYLSIRHIPHKDYMTYICTFELFSELPKEAKGSIDYMQYLEDLRSYLDNFLRRSQPLFDADAYIRRAVAEASSAWDDHSSKAGDEDPLYCKACCKRFASQGVYKGHLGGKAHKKASAALANGNMALAGAEVTRRSDVFKTESVIVALCNQVRENIDATKAFVQKKQTMTREELEAERQAEDMVEDAESDDDEEDDKPIYNPKNVPLGWDGKPIPYWLYKLHGLNLEYKCEVCGNFSYWGPRNFERHFQEWRHSYGMKCLRVPNSKHFHGVTKIADVLELYAQLQQKEKSGWNAERDEEYEDDQGNVFNKKTYQDMRRQGLIA